ncbi:FAD-dependent monooxygenase [Metabacillus litoralis]|uniref:FAD-dependent monooxygenase n=1 Tax=Metabacillus litoralis TaxID=152268 RepID=UPI00204239A2|nr:FAD-dependent monooxygenase [Metabacillus litoralis]MCM3651763.1 FAD-dependent monooxygenase [Metabacillus litoralis]
MYDKDVVIVGSGPGGALLGFLLAKSGVDVLVIEKSASLKRDFRGETIAPGSVHILKRLGILDKIPSDAYLKVQQLIMYDKDDQLLNIDFHNFEHEQKYGIDIPQPTILNTILNEASQYKNFLYLNDTSCVDLIENSSGEVTGIKCKKGSESFEVKCRLVVGADGRFSTIRKLSRLNFKKEGYQRDLVWLKVPKPQGWVDANIIKVDRDDHLIILPTYPDLLRIGTYVEKDGLSAARTLGLEHFKQRVIAIEPKLEDTINEHIKDWKDTTFLEIFSTYVPKWSRDGLILIGDAAHTLSPVLGQGVNVAMQDAVELAPYIEKALQSQKEEDFPLKSEAFIEFEEKRQKNVSFVAKFQEEQEKRLGARTDEECNERKTSMKLIDSNPLKYRMMSPVQYGIALEI